jgi:hypothetical protein
MVNIITPMSCVLSREVRGTGQQQPGRYRLKNPARSDTRNPMRPVGPILYAGIVYNFRPNFNWAISANPPGRFRIGLPFYPTTLAQTFSPTVSNT